MNEQTTSSIATLEEVPLREVWANEAADFTPWLADNPEHLAKELHMNLELEGSEVPVGPFSADLVLRDTNTGEKVVVENLLKATDHDHLGKLITYAAGLQADWAVLVASHFRPEHRSALAWLNSISDKDNGFFGVEVRAVRIGNSNPAVELKVVVEPDDFSREARSSSRSGARALYHDWWSNFLPAFVECHPDLSYVRKPSDKNYMDLKSINTRHGIIRYRLWFHWYKRHESHSNDDCQLRAMLYMDDGEAAYPLLEAKRQDIDSSTKLQLHWEPQQQDTKYASVSVYLNPAKPEDRDKWGEYQDWAIEAIVELDRVFSSYINELT
ncbi:DUF4268 domain-containing protein [Candidatus Poriferisocius sp.]|uniref:DUF4268 domain-containing protein n=1 Tax=Candidatus Poriferisocius sp. TaxID=3101276 RepID=UPI003B015D33